MAFLACAVSPFGDSGWRNLYGGAHEAFWRYQYGAIAHILTFEIRDSAFFAVFTFYL